MTLPEILNHLGEEHERYFGAVAPPIIQTSNFCYRTVAEMRTALRDEFSLPVYSRGINPTVTILRKKLAALEHTEDALVTASGCAAISTAVIALLKQGDHVVCVEKPYSWTFTLFTELLQRFGIHTTFVDGRETENFRRAIRPETRLIYLESPNTMTFDLQDLAAVAALAREKGIITVCDNSYATPLAQNPADLGIDLVVHSATKYLSGHSDVVAGAICGSTEMIRRIFSTELMTLGGILSPHDAWLMLRGLRTIHLRLERSSNSALALAGFLEKHPKVEKVFYPFLASHQQYELAGRQMKFAGGLFSVILKAKSPEDIERFCESLKMFLLAVSWGGYESLVFPAIAFSPGEKADSIPWNLVRFYIGLEDPEVLRYDLENAMKLL
jgi:cystathionine beta-lyase/cystathionine gamma-synthase